MTEQPDDETVIRPFSNWLREVQTGRTHDELSEKLHELIAAVVETGRKGSLAVKFTIAPMKNSTHILVVDDQVALSLPAYDRETTVFFPDKHGNLSRKDPNQLEIPTVVAVPSPADPIALDKQGTDQ